MSEPIFKLDFKTFVRSPFAYLFFIVLTGLIYLGRTLIASKDAEISNQMKQIEDCDAERKADKKMMQEIIFQKELKDKLNGE